MEARNCDRCQTAVSYCDVHDACFCGSCDLWTEDACSDPACIHCASRPPAPSRCAHNEEHIPSADAAAVPPRLPPEDQPDVIRIGRHVIPIIENDDPRVAEERAFWSACRSKAAAMHSPDELLAGLDDPEMLVRFEVIPRLKVRGKDDPRTVPALVRVLREDPSAEVRGLAATALVEFETAEATAGLLAAEDDADPDVRWDVQYALCQFGLRPPPEGM